MRQTRDSGAVGSQRLHRIVSGVDDTPPKKQDAHGAHDETRAPTSRRLSMRGWDTRSVRAFSMVVAVLLIITGWWWWSGRAQIPAAISELVASGAPLTSMPLTNDAGPVNSSAVGSPQSPQRVVVHVAGDVKTPGLVELPWGSRVSDAITAAGGAVSPDSLSSVNLARQIVDGEQIIVGGVESPISDGRISINAASATELQELPGVGPVLAERIVAYREQNGPFVSLDGLLEVSGIGETTLANMTEQVRM